MVIKHALKSVMWPWVCLGDRVVARDEQWSVEDGRILGLILQVSVRGKEDDSAVWQTLQCFVSKPVEGAHKSLGCHSCPRT